MSNIEKSAESLSEIVDVFRCPLCHSSMKVMNLKSIICSNNHTFDIAKQGYVNMMTRPANSHYDKKLFEARQEIIAESDLYELLHEKTSEMIKEYLDVSNNPTIMLDAGCGEGSHLQMVLDECNNEAITGIGLDVSKEGIIMAAKKYKTPFWLVGDLASAPLVDQSTRIILNILSPANYKEFKRVLAPDGFVIKVVPRANYLKELRDIIFTDENKQKYSNDDKVSLFKQHFDLVKHSKLSYSKVLKQEELMNLVQMSPLTWNVEKERLGIYMNQGSPEITVDLDILVGVNGHAKRGGM